VSALFLRVRVGCGKFLILILEIRPSTNDGSFGHLLQVKSLSVCGPILIAFQYFITRKSHPFYLLLVISLSTAPAAMMFTISKSKQLFRGKNHAPKF